MESFSLKFVHASKFWPNLYIQFFVLSFLRSFKLKHPKFSLLSQLDDLLTVIHELVWVVERFLVQRLFRTWHHSQNTFERVWKLPVWEAKRSWTIVLWLTFGNFPCLCYHKSVYHSRHRLWFHKFLILNDDSHDRFSLQLSTVRIALFWNIKMKILKRFAFDQPCLSTVTSERCG